MFLFSASSTPLPTQGPGSFLVLLLMVSAGSAIVAAAGALWWRWANRPTALPHNLPYQLKKGLFSRRERSVFEMLQVAAGPEFCVLTKVRLADLLDVPRGTPRWMEQYNRVRAKNVDFLICDAEEMQPRAVVEIVETDDSLHRRTRAEFLSRALAAAKLPLLRLSAVKAPPIAELRRTLASALGRPLEMTPLKVVIRQDAQMAA